MLIPPDGNVVVGLFYPENTGTGGRVTFGLTQPGKQTVDVKYGGLSVKNRYTYEYLHASPIC